MRVDDDFPEVVSVRVTSRMKAEIKKYHLDLRNVIEKALIERKSTKHNLLDEKMNLEKEIYNLKLELAGAEIELEDVNMRLGGE